MSVSHSLRSKVLRRRRLYESVGKNDKRPNKNGQSMQGLYFTKEMNMDGELLKRCSVTQRPKLENV